MATWTGWRTHFLLAAGVKETNGNVKFLGDWNSHAETDCADNPIDLRHRVGASSNCAALPNSTAHAQKYLSHADAVSAFAAQVTSPRYVAIFDALESGDPHAVDDPSAVVAALKAWGSPKFAAAYDKETAPPPPPPPPPPPGSSSGGGGDTQINPLGTAAVPASWTLPASLNLQLKNVYASYDGSGAAGSFVPCLELVSDSGHTIGSYPCGTTVAAGASADVTWFPRVSGGATGTSTGVVAAYANRPNSTIYAVGSNHVVVWSTGTFLTSDSSAFTLPSGTPMNLLHGGLVRTDVAITFGANGGVPYTGEFQLQTEILDSLSNPVDQMTGPNYYAAELYATDPGDTFLLSGTATFNCDDSSFTPPYTLKTTITNLTAITATSTSLVVSIESPTGLT